MKKLLKVDEVAEKIGVNRSTVYRLKDKGLPFLKIGTNIRFDEDAINEWIKEQNKERC